ncbi:MAG TPA: hypothetical protein DCM32_05655 [Xanthomonadaceae bacterium]|jgi:hypothetical protein|nr:hypothetical protein [Xanthomonadaceae bacterium]
MSIFRLPRITTAQRTPLVLELGELVYDTDLNQVFRGNGLTAGGLPFAGGSQSFVHTQASPSPSWTVNHNLGFRPAVEVYSVGGAEIEAAILHTSVNQTAISFSTPTAGSARFT